MRSWLVFVLCLAPRLVALWWWPPDTTVYYYWDTSGAILAEASYTEPLYPAFLAAARWLTGDSLTLVMGCQTLLASLGGVLVYRLTSQIVSARAAVVSAILYAFDPYLVRQSVSPVEITACTVLLIAAGLALAGDVTRRHAAVAGLCLAGASLTRFSLLPVAATTMLLVTFARPRNVARAAAFAVAAGAPIAAWMLWTYTTFGVVAPSRIGINLFISTSQYTGQVRDVDLLVSWAHDITEPELPRHPLSEAERYRIRDRILLKKALRFAREHPVETAKIKLTNLALSMSPLLLPLDYKTRNAFAVVDGGRVRTVGLEPRPLRDRVVYVASRAVLLCGAVAGLIVRWRRRTLADNYMIGVAAVVLLVCTLFFPTSRLLAPMAFVLMIYSAAAIDAAFAR